MTDARPLGEAPDDPFLRAVAEHWDEILELADDEQRERLLGLVTDTVESDPADARAMLTDELFDLLPPGHPVIQAMGPGIMYSNPDPDQAEARLASAMQWLSGQLSGGDPDVEPVTSTSDDDPPDTSANDRDDFDQQVEERLLSLPSVSADEARLSHADPDDDRLIRLPQPDHAIRLPSFQFTPVGTPWPIVQEVNAMLDSAADPWGVTCWWVDPHGQLGTAPADLIGQGQDDLLRQVAAAIGEEY